MPILTAFTPLIICKMYEKKPSVCIWNLILTIQYLVLYAPSIKHIISFHISNPPIWNRFFFIIFFCAFFILLPVYIPNHLHRILRTYLIWFPITIFTILPVVLTYKKDITKCYRFFFSYFIFLFFFFGWYDGINAMCNNHKNVFLWWRLWSLLSD